ncbi:TetR/AcrR family transcriptional regulator [Brenneria izbisi]|uniref:TetR/AcrR family transcriptional regulator n=1 Tax=Brenneria izbisi TaxID=2939450 RepID=A0AA41XW12_9GAMM|nr:TetR/AcrR family transcriptional regulator [Brenneria izbisi]MCV9877496.1 TetR/AcrR family transcriptional regulator [Brenneria izbisi]MCV9880938.1 TetR/AcrR family transcriptional regulator [Brenneria izbisi]
MINKREVILKSALQLFRKKGFHAVGVDEIIEVAGVARMTLYNHFGSKDNLIVTLLQERGEYLMLALNENILKEESLKSKIISIFDWHSSMSYSCCHATNIFTMAMSEYHCIDGCVRKVIDDFKSSKYRLIRDLLLEEFCYAEAERKALVIFSLLEGAFITSLTLGKRESFKFAREHVINNF